jgi:hypothetical protein
MADRITLINQRDGKVHLGPDPDEMEKFLALPEAKRVKGKKPLDRILQAGESITVSADEAPKLLRHSFLKDASTVLQGAESPEVKRLKAELEAEKVKTAKLEELAAKRGSAKSDEEKAADEEAKARKAELKAINKKGARVLMQDGGLGSVVKLLSKKDMAKLGLPGDGVEVKLDVNGNVSPFALDTLKLAPEA